MDGQRISGITPEDVAAAQKEKDEQASGTRANPMKDAVYIERGGPSRIEFRDGQLIEHGSGAKRTAVKVNENSTLQQATSEKSIIVDATGERMSVAKAMQMGWVTKTADGYKATPQGADLFPSFKSAPAATVNADAAKGAEETADDTKEQEQQEAVVEAGEPDPIMAESPTTQEFLSAAVAVLGPAHAQAVLDAHLDGLPNLAEQLVGKMELSETQRGKVSEVVAEMSAKLDAVALDAGLAEEDLGPALAWATENKSKELREARAAAIKGQTGKLRDLVQSYQETKMERGTHGPGITVYRESNGMLMVILPGHGSLSVREAQRKGLIVVSEGD